MHLKEGFLSRLKRILGKHTLAGQPCIEFKYEAQIRRARNTYHESGDQAVYLAYLKTDPPHGSTQ